MLMDFTYLSSLNLKQLNFSLPYLFLIQWTRSMNSSQLARQMTVREEIMKFTEIC